MCGDADERRVIFGAGAGNAFQEHTTPSESLDDFCCWPRGILWVSSSNGGRGGEPTFCCLLDASLVRLLIGTFPLTAFACGARVFEPTQPTRRNATRPIE